MRFGDLDFIFDQSWQEKSCSGHQFTPIYLLNMANLEKSIFRKLKFQKIFDKNRSKFPVLNIENRIFNFKDIAAFMIT